MAEEYERLNDLICANRSPLWDERQPLELRLSRMCLVRDELNAEWQSALDDDDVGAIDTGVLLGGLELVTGLLSEDFGALRQLVPECSWWRPEMPDKERLSRIMGAREMVRSMWQEYLADDYAPHVDTGALLGVLNLIDGLLESVDIQPPDEDQD